MSKEKILEEFDKKYYSKYLLNGDKIPAFEMNNAFLEDVKQFISKAIDQTRKETIRNEIEYWKGVFDNRPKDRDLESDNIAQNFARIEIERLKSLINK